MVPARILIAEDDETARHVMEAVLKKQKYEVLSASNAEQAMEILQRSPMDLVVTDLHLPAASGLELLKKARAIYADTAVIIITAFGTIQSAVEAMKAGAYDYLTKPVHPYELTALVSRALEHHRLITEVALLRTCLEEKYGFENIIGSSASLMRMLDVAARVAPSDVTVLLHGETGAGKELVAKAIHFRSPRGSRPFVTVNCGSIPRELLESELFGHIKGSFTGALSHKKGKAEVAEGGTVLLDEIGELPLELQVRIFASDPGARNRENRRDKSNQAGCANHCGDAPRSRRNGEGWDLSRGPLLQTNGRANSNSGASRTAGRYSCTR